MLADVRRVVLRGDRKPWPYLADLRARVERERAKEDAAQLAFKTGPGGLMDVDFLAGGGLLERGARDFPAFPSVAAMLACTLPEERTRALLADYGALRVVEARARWVAGRPVEEIPAAGEGLVAIAELSAARARARGAARPDPRAATAHPRRLSGGRRRRGDRRAPGLIDGSRPLRVPSQRPGGRMTARLAYPAFDCDNHYYEALDAFTRHMDPRLAKKAVQWAVIDGRKRLLVAERINRFIPNPTFDPVAKPGCLDHFFRGDNPEGLDIRAAFGELEPIRPAYRDREARLALMDEQGIEGCLLFPTLGVGIEHPLRHDADLTHATLHAFNQWLDEDWGFAWRERIFAAPMLSLMDVEAGRRGARVGARTRRARRAPARGARARRRGGGRSAIATSIRFGRA